MQPNNMAESIQFDREEIRARYREERDKRLRSDANAQYIATNGIHSRFRQDPFAGELIERAPVTKSTEVLIIGAGLAGILSGVRLRKAGFDDIRIVDQAAGFGGTWYWNRYPGIQCDIESYIYLPLLEEMGYMPTQKYAQGAEIRAYLQGIAKHNGLYGDTLFQTTIAGLDWQREQGSWAVSTDRGDEFSAQYIFVCNGPFAQPKLPGISGIEDFEGHTFHTSRWDFEYTGGDENGGLDKLSDKRVGIIGTGATGIQCVPHLGKYSKHLFVFQRTPSAVDVRANRPTDEEWFKSQIPGWQQARMQNFVSVVHGADENEDLVSDGWTKITRELTGLAVARESKRLGRKLTSEERKEFLEMADIRTMENIRNRVETVVSDSETAEHLKPWYARWCKRPCFHDEFLDTFNRDNVSLVDTNGKGVQEITAKGVVVDGQLYELDCLIFSTGFEVGTNFAGRLGFEINGVGSEPLSAKWENGLKTLHGMYTAGFPNLFFTGTTQTGVTYNYTHMVLEQTAHLAHVLKSTKDRNLGRIEATKDGEADWVNEIRRLARYGTAYYEQCTPGYFSGEGNLEDPNGILSGSYGAGPVAFFELLRDWREDGGFKGLELK